MRQRPPRSSLGDFVDEEPANLPTWPSPKGFQSPPQTTRARLRRRQEVSPAEFETAARDELAHRQRGRNNAGRRSRPGPAGTAQQPRQHPSTSRPMESRRPSRPTPTRQGFLPNAARANLAGLIGAVPAESRQAVMGCPRRRTFLDRHRPTPSQIPDKDTYILQRHLHGQHQHCPQPHGHRERNKQPQSPIQLLVGGQWHSHRKHKPQPPDL